MPINQNTGVYTPASGALTATPGQVVQSAVWDAIFTDLSNSLTAIEQQLQSTYGQRNIIGSNGGMEVWQRGAGGAASFAISASSTAYTADRWYLMTNANESMTVAQVAGIVTGSRFAAKVQRNNAQTGTQSPVFGFPLDSDECAMIAGQVVALSFTAKAGANFSPANGTLTAFIAAGTGSPVKQVAGYTNQTLPLGGGANLTASAQRFTFVSSVVPLTTTQAEVLFEWTMVGTAGADDSFTIDNVQLEILPSATSPIAQFENWSFERMLLACKRHYRKSFPYSTAPAQGAGASGAAAITGLGSSGGAGFWIQHSPVSLRATGAYTTFNPSGSSANAQNLTTGVSLAVIVDPSGTSSPDTMLIFATATSAGGQTAAIHYTADAGI